MTKIQAKNNAKRKTIGFLFQNDVSPCEFIIDSIFSSKPTCSTIIMSFMEMVNEYRCNKDNYKSYRNEVDCSYRNYP